MEGLPALRAVLEAGYDVRGIITLTPDAAASRSGAVDHAPLAAEFGVPLGRVCDINDSASVALLHELAADIVLVIGWTQLVGSAARAAARVGVIGAHASLLPRDRGRAPVNWAIIHGRQETGASLLWLAEGVDTGNLIDQRPIAITEYDTCGTIYEKIAAANRSMILDVLPRLAAGERPGRPQSDLEAPPLPRRRPEDGRIDWSLPGRRVYDLIRALARPYPGAFSRLDGEVFRVWEAALFPDRGVAEGVAGQVIGPCISPREDACGQIVRCGGGAVLLLELEDARGRIIRGRALSERVWTDKVWSHG
jgi:methionyl-tRNA formyltransferase